jgi:hypothetical protein
MHMAMGPHSFSTFLFQLRMASNDARSVVENASTAAPALWFVWVGGDGREEGRR